MRGRIASKYLFSSLNLFKSLPITPNTTLHPSCREPRFNVVFQHTCFMQHRRTAFEDMDRSFSNKFENVVQRKT